MCQTLGWVAQAVALDRGELFTVQLVVSLQVVIALPLGVLLTAQQVGRREGLGAAAVVLGLGVFVAVANPAGGRSDAPGETWLVATAAITVLAVGVAAAAVRARPAMRAALLAAAAGTLFGFQAAVTKVFVGVVDDGAGAIVSNWSTYALLLSAVGGLYLTQMSLQAGALAASVASSNASTTVTSLALARFVFLETPSRTTAGKVASVIALGLALAGLLAIARGGTAVEGRPDVAGLPT